eukprot:Sdes_comp18889_c0_seq1m9326
MASVLSQRNMVEINLPLVYGPKYRSSLKADADSVNLFSWSPHYYEMGMKLSSLLEEPGLPISLREAFTCRLHQVMDLSLNSSHEDTTKYTSKFDELERVLFLAGYQSVIEFQNWHSRKSRFLNSFSLAKGFEPTHVDNLEKENSARGEIQANHYDASSNSASKKPKTK